MNKCGMAVLVVVGLMGQSLPADIIAGDGESRSDSNMPWVQFERASNSLVSSDQLQREDIENYLTFLRQETDSDKDGFVERSTLGEVNPTGYVVFHFRSRQLNQRVSLGGEGGGLLSSPMNCGGGAGGKREQDRPYDWPGPLDEDDKPREEYPGPDPVDPSPPVPEPATAGFLLIGAVMALTRSCRRTRRTR